LILWGFFYFRHVTGIFPELRNSQKNILDGELLWKYTNLSIMEKIEIAKRLGTSNDQVSAQEIPGKSEKL
jgi:cleavage and polyadenylation specificity factor subunit 1